MKKLQKVFILLMTVVLLGGCTLKSEISMNINSDKSMDYSFIYAVDDDMIQTIATSKEQSEAEERLSAATDKTLAYQQAVTDAYALNQASDDPVQITIDGITGDINDASIIGEITVEGETATSGTFNISYDGVVTISDLVFDGYICSTNEDGSSATCILADDSYTSEEATEESTTDDTIAEESTTDETDNVSLTDEEIWAIIDEEIFTEAYLSVYEDAGYEMERYDEDGYKGYIFTKTFDNFEDVTYADLYIDTYSDESSEESTTDDTIAEESTTDDTTAEESTTSEDNITYIYKLNGIDDLTEKVFTKDNLIYTVSIPSIITEEDIQSETGEEDISSLYEYKYVITLPNEVISSNANAVSNNGKTLTWTSVETDIEFEFSLINKNVIYAVIGGIALILLIIIILIIRKISKKRKNKKEKKATKENSAVDNPVPGIPINNPEMMQGLNTTVPEISVEPVESSVTSTSQEAMVNPVTPPVESTMQEPPATETPVTPEMPTVPEAPSSPVSTTTVETESTPANTNVSDFSTPNSNSVASTQNTNLNAPADNQITNQNVHNNSNDIETL